MLLKNNDGFWLPYDVMLKLKNDGKLELGINNELARSLAENGVTSNKSSASAAYFFWLTIAFSIVIYSIYLSFTARWWSFIVGYLIAGVIYNANKKGAAQNYLGVAIQDEGLYNKIMMLKGWMYNINAGEMPNLQQYYLKK